MVWTAFIFCWSLFVRFCVPQVRLALQRVFLMVDDILRSLAVGAFSFERDAYDLSSKLPARAPLVCLIILSSSHVRLWSTATGTKKLLTAERFLRRSGLVKSRCEKHGAQEAPCGAPLFTFSAKIFPNGIFKRLCLVQRETSLLSTSPFFLIFFFLSWVSSLDYFLFHIPPKTIFLFFFSSYLFFLSSFCFYSHIKMISFLQDNFNLQIVLPQWYHP
jgi:hypothetical protein